MANRVSEEAAVVNRRVNANPNATLAEKAEAKRMADAAASAMVDAMLQCQLESDYGPQEGDVESKRPCSMEAEEGQYFMIFNTTRSDRRYINVNQVAADLKALEVSAKKKTKYVRPKLIINKELNWFAKFYMVGVDPSDVYIGEQLKGMYGK